MTHVDCMTCREAISARLDGEPEPGPAERTDEHLASCAECRAWQVRVAASSRALRVRRAPAVPDLSDDILAVVVPPAKPQGWWVRGALIGVATAQLSLALSQLLGVGPLAAHGAAPAPLAGHLFNEGTAWNVALGIGLLWAAFRARVTSGLIPVLSAFVLLLGIYSAHDLVTGAAPPSRVLGHGLLLLGLGLLVVINRRYDDPAPQPGEELDDTRAHATSPDAEPGERTATDQPTGGGRRHRHLRPAGRHRAA